MTVFELWDDDSYHALATRAVRLARETGALSMLPITLVYRSGLHVFGGELAAASALIQELDAIALATGTTPLMYVGSSTAPGAASRRKRWSREREGPVVAIAGYGAAVLDNGLGRYEAAFDARAASSDEGDYGYAASLPELVEAASALRPAGGRRRRAAPARGAHARRGHGLGARRPGPVAARSARAPPRALGTARRSSGWSARAIRMSSPAPVCCTASGSGARTGASTRASSFESPTRRSAAPGPKRSPSAPP